MKTHAAGLIAFVSGVGISLVLGNAMAETKATVADLGVVTSKTAKAPMSMTDSQLDTIVAGSTSKLTGNTPPGHTIVTTSGGVDGSGQSLPPTCYYTTGSGKPSSKPC